MLIMRLIVMAGRPGTGKSSIAEAVGRELNTPVFAKDWLEAVLRRCRLRPGPEHEAVGLGYAGYELLTTLAERQLHCRQSAILDSVAGTESIRSQWRALAVRYEAAWIVIECVCSDESLHRQRLASRQRGIPGWPELTWNEVEKVKSYYAPWQDKRLVLDAVNSVAANVATAVGYIYQNSQ
jgi:predicted kinase